MLSHHLISDNFAFVHILVGTTQENQVSLDCHTSVADPGRFDADPDPLFM